MHTNGERSPTLFLTLPGRGWPRSTHRNHPLLTRTCTRVCTAASHFSAGSLCHMHTLSGMYAEEAEGVKLGIRYLDDFRWIGWAISAKVDKANRRGWLEIVRWILVDPWEKIERCTLIDYVIANGRLERFCLGRDYMQGIFKWWNNEEEIEKEIGKVFK